MLVIPQIGQTGEKFLEMLKHLQFTDIHLRITPQTLKLTMVSDSRLRTEENVVTCVQSILSDNRKMWGY